MTNYIVTLAVDEQWLEAIQNFTSDVYEGEVCKWISLDADIEGISN